MGSRTVRLDDEAEQILQEIRNVTGLSISDALKSGLISFRDQALKKSTRRAYDIYKEQDLGPGGYAIAPSTEVRKSVHDAIRQKLNK